MAGLSHPLILEAYNVEMTTAEALTIGSTGEGTRVGYFLANLARAFGADIVRWESERELETWHLRIHLSYLESAPSSQS